MRSSKLGLTIVAVFGAAALTAACEGDNLFSGDTPEVLPRVLTVSAPPTALAGDTISVRVDAVAARGISQVQLSLSGAITQDTVVDILPPRAQVSQSIRIAMPAILQDSLLQVQASVSDVFGNVSRRRETQVLAYGPPSVSSVSAPPTVRPGEVVTFQVGVQGARPVSRLDFQIRGAFTRDTSIVVQPAQRSVTQELTVQVPTVVQDTVLTLNVYARDLSGFTSPAKTLDIPLAVDPPVLSLEVPSTARAGDKLEVKVKATGLRHVEQIRVELRGAAVKDTAVSVDPLRTELEQTIAVGLPGKIYTSLLAVHVYAIDTGSKISATKSDTVTVPVGPPVVNFVDVPSGVFDGDPVRVVISGAGDRPLSRIVVNFSGAVVGTQTFPVPDLTHQFTIWPSAIVPDDPDQAVVVVEAIAWDVTETASGKVAQVIPVTIVTDSTSSGPSPDFTTTRSGAASMRAIFGDNARQPLKEASLRKE